MEPWNDRTLLPPPLHTFHCNKFIDINNLRSTCEDITRVLTKQSPLHQESAILSRFIYKFDKKFRNDIGFRKFKKVNTCLRRYLSINFLKDVELFSSLIPSNSDESYLPTRQLLEYVLVRLISFSKIMEKIYVTVKQAAVFYLDRIKRGESHWMSLMPYAVLCRIWSLVKILLQHVQKWYPRLYKYLNVLELKGLLFLNSNIVLPSNLGTFLNIKEIDELGKFSWTASNRVNIVPILNDNEEEDSYDFFKYIRDINKADADIDEDTEDEMKNEPLPIENNMSITATNTRMFSDVGEKISRESFMGVEKLKQVQSKSKDITISKKSLKSQNKKHRR